MIIYNLQPMTSYTCIISDSCSVNNSVIYGCLEAEQNKLKEKIVFYMLRFFFPTVQHTSKLFQEKKVTALDISHSLSSTVIYSNAL